MSEVLEARISSSLATQNWEEAFGLIMSGYKERLYWHIRNMVLSHEDSNDILQNTLIKIWKNLPKFKGKSQMYSWCYRIATNETLTFIEQQKKKGALSIEAHAQLAETIKSDEYFDGDEAQAQLLAAVKTLPEKQQLVFNMKYFQDMKYQEMAEILETSVGGLKATYHHAVKKIETYIKGIALD